MIEPISLNTSFYLMFSSLSATLAVVSPGQYAAQAGSVFLGVFGGAMVQLWSIDTRKPTRNVMLADIMASALAGFGVPCLGVPSIISIANKFLPDEAHINFALTENVGLTLFVAGIAGMFGAGYFRKALDKFNPSWMGKNGNE